MKKIFIMVVAVCLTAVTVTAQNGYIRIGIGGGIALPTYGYINNYTDNNSATSSGYSEESKSLGLGNGLNANLAVGYHVSKFFGVELGFNEFYGFKSKGHYSSTSPTSSSTSDYEMSGMMLQIIPAVTLSPGLEKINPYARIGVIIGVINSIVEKYNHVSSYNESKSTHTEDYKSKESGGVPIGFTAAGGVTFNLSKAVDFYAEMVFNGLHYSPAKGKYLSWTIDGADRLATASTKEKEWVYKKKYNSEDQSDDEPDMRGKISYPFTDVLVNVGIRIKFGKSGD